MIADPLARGLTAVKRIARGSVAWVDERWDGAGGRLADREILRDAGLAVVAVLYLAIDTARSALDAGIKKIHAEGVAGVSTNSLHNGTTAVKKAFETWNLGWDRLRIWLRFQPVPLARVQTVLELLLVPLAFLVFYGIVKALRGRVSDQRIATLLGYSALGVILNALLGVLNQVLELVILGGSGSPGWLGSVLHVSGLARVNLRLLILVPVVIGVLSLLRPVVDGSAGEGGADSKQARRRLRLWRGTGTTYRVLIVAVVLHAVLMLVGTPGAQSQDALRLWVQTPGLGVLGLALTAVLSLSLAAIALRLGTDANPKREVLERKGTGRLAIVGAALILVGAVARTGLLRHQAWGAGALAAGVLVFVIAALSWPLVSRSATVDLTVVPPSPAVLPGADITVPDERHKRVVPAILAAAPLTTVGVALVRASVPSIIDSNSSGRLVLWTIPAFGLAVVGFVLARAIVPWAFRGTENEAARTKLFVFVELVVVVVCATVYALAIDDPWKWAPRFGVPAIIATFMAALVVVFGTLGHWMESRKLPAALDVVGFRRLPVIFGLIVLGFLSHRFDGDGYHDVKTMGDATMPASPQLTVETAFDRWTIANLGDASVVDQAPAVQQAEPLVFIAAAGGGIKAAAFTSAALDCLFVGANVARDACASTPAWSQVFAASGASGGSVGIASIMAQQQLDAANAGSAAAWVSNRFGTDLLSPELAWQLLVEAPNAIINFTPGLDRGEVLQESWRRQFEVDQQDPASGAFYADTADQPWTQPLVFFSGTNLNDGCRVNISSARSAQRMPPNTTRAGACKDQRVLDNGPAPDQAGTRDLVDYLCDRNIDLASAAFLSARFPLVSPAATIHCDDGDLTTNDNLSIGDGGYRDNSGAASIMDTWSVLEPLVSAYNTSHDRCIVPILIEINNGYAGLAGSKPGKDVAQAVAPLIGATSVFGDLSYGPIEQGAAEFSRSLSPDVRVRSGDKELTSRFFRLSLVDHPGVTAPLGWSLSDAAVNDLVKQVTEARNLATLTELRAILDGASTDGLTCASA
ncbi:MAG: hypothetical protein ABI706_01770 [Ilumatobacteraceae bacterium]